MLFKNKVTGLIWEVKHPDHIKRCNKSKDYEEVKVTKRKSTRKIKESDEGEK